MLLTRLTEAGMFDEAHDIWVRSLPPDRREEADLLYNEGFRYPLTNLPFDWVILPVSNAIVRVETQNGARTINVDFFGGRVKFEHVSHLLNLAPGPYRFQGRERSQDLQNERGLRWRIACVGDDAQTLGTTDLVSGDTPWRTFAVDFRSQLTSASIRSLSWNSLRGPRLRRKLSAGSLMPISTFGRNGGARSATAEMAVTQDPWQ